MKNPREIRTGADTRAIDYIMAPMRVGQSSAQLFKGPNNLKHEIVFQKRDLRVPATLLLLGLGASACGNVQTATVPTAATTEVSGAFLARYENTSVQYSSPRLQHVDNRLLDQLGVKEEDPDKKEVLQKKLSAIFAKPFIALTNQFGPKLVGEMDYSALGAKGVHGYALELSWKGRGLVYVGYKENGSDGFFVVAPAGAIVDKGSNDDPSVDQISQIVFQVGYILGKRTYVEPKLGILVRKHLPDVNIYQADNFVLNLTYTFQQLMRERIPLGPEQYSMDIYTTSGGKDIYAELEIVNVTTGKVTYFKIYPDGTRVPFKK